MKTITSILLLVSLQLAINANSQTRFSDTLSKDEIISLENALRHSTFGAVFLADSFSRIKDTQNASLWFMKIDPYYFVWAWNSPSDIDKIFAHKALSSQVKIDYKKKYLDLLSQPQSEDYSVFEKMHKEDQKIRKNLERCGDSFTCAVAKERMKSTDFQHFRYLYQYTEKKGWPSISNGSLFASTLAIHDAANADYYIPLMKKAIMEGKLPLEPLKLIYAKRTDVRCYNDLRMKLDTSVKFTFVFNSLLTHTLPSNLERFKNTVRKYCPVECMIVYEWSSTSFGSETWLDEERRRFYKSEDRNCIRQLFNIVRENCPKTNVGKETVFYLPTERKWDRVVVYIILKQNKSD